MAYLTVDFEQVKGFDKLSDHGKDVFKRVYQKHNAVHGHEQKKNWIPVKVAHRSNYLKVTFTNGEWLHYYPNNTWG